MHNNFYAITFFAASLLCASCGFRMQTMHEPLTVAIPYCQGDSDGLFTAALISEVEKKGTFTYSASDARFKLQVKLLDAKLHTIGYRFNPKKLLHGEHSLIQNEGRLKALAEVSVIDTLATETKKVVLGPAYIEASCDFDHENYTIDHDANRFSLGQLTDIDTTMDVASIPLYRNLARNIAAYLQTSFDCNLYNK